MSLGATPERKLYATHVKTHAGIDPLSPFVDDLVSENTGEILTVATLGSESVTQRQETYEKILAFSMTHPNPLSPKEAWPTDGEQPSDRSGRFTEPRRWASSIRCRYL